MPDTAARLTIAVRRYEIARFTIAVTGIDLTGVAMNMQVRLDRGTPGAPLIQLSTVATTTAEGLKLDSVTIAAGVPTSIIKGRINQSTTSDAAKLPYMGESGSDSVFKYAMQWTLNGDAQTRLEGDFIVRDSAFGSDNAPADRPESYGSSQTRYAGASGSLTFGDQVVQVSIGGIAELAPLLAQTTATATAAQAAATSLTGSVTDIAAAKQQLSDIMTYGLPLPGWLQVLRLAQKDGWACCYDPGNPLTLATTTGPNGTVRIASIADGLGLQPPAVQADTTLQPELWSSHFGGLSASGWEDPIGGTQRYLRTASFTPGVAQPFSVMCLANFAGQIPPANYRHLIDGRSPTATNNLELFTDIGSGLSNGAMAARIGTSGNSPTILGDPAKPTDWEPRTHGVLVNGASSKLYRDGQVVNTGNFGTNFITGFTIGNTYTVSNQWVGGIGPLLMHRAPTDEVIARMDALLRSLVTNANFARDLWIGGVQ